MSRSTKEQFEIKATVVVDEERMFIKIDPRQLARAGFVAESAAVFGDDTLIVNFVREGDDSDG
jgi:hypothetical protein